MATTQVDYPIPSSTQRDYIVYEAKQIKPCNSEGRAFNNIGLAYPHQMAEKYRKEFRKTRDVEKIAKYADVVTVAFPDWLATITPGTISPSDRKDINATLLANVAYLSLHCKRQEDRDKFKTLLATIY